MAIKFNLQKIREARDYAELLANLNGLEKELKMMFAEAFIGERINKRYLIREILGDE